MIILKRLVHALRIVMSRTHVKHTAFKLEKERAGGLENRRPLIERIMRDCRGWIDVIIMFVNGTRIVCDEGAIRKSDHIAASLPIAEATLAVSELLGSKGFDEIKLQLQGGRYIIVRKHRDCYIAALTKPNPNLGLIDLAFKKNIVPDRLLKIISLPTT